MVRGTGSGPLTLVSQARIAELCSGPKSHQRHDLQGEKRRGVAREPEDGYIWQEPDGGSKDCLVR